MSLTPEAMQMVRIIANKDKDSPYSFPMLQSEEGAEAANREYQSVLRSFNQRLAVLRQCLGMQSALSTYAARHTWACLLYTSRYTPRLFAHVYTGTKADKKSALEALDIGTLVRGTETDLSKRIPSSSLQKAKMLFVFMFMMRGLPFVRCV